MALIQDQKYKMSLKRKYGNRHNYYGYNSNFGNWFKLIRITQCSDNGIYFFVIFDVYISVNKIKTSYREYFLRIL